MAVDLNAPANVEPARPLDGVRPYRFTVDQYLKMIGAGVFDKGGRAELLGGIVVRRRIKREPHNFAVECLGEILRGLAPKDWRVREEKSVVLGDHWRPEPDIALVRGPYDRSRLRAPRAEEIALLVEVADSTYRADRGVKWRRYAACRVATYWIVNIPGRVVEVHGDPAGEGKAARYESIRSFGPGEPVPVDVDGVELGRFDASEVLP